jgi:hypothetical protein
MWGIHTRNFDQELQQVEQESDPVKKLKLLNQKKADFQKNNKGTHADEVIDQYNTEIDKIKAEIEISKTLGSSNNTHDTSKALSNNRKPNKSFKDFLLKELPEKHMHTLRKFLCEAKGKRVATVILALEEKGYLIPNERNKKALFEAMQAEFKVTGTYSGVSNYLNPNNKGFIEKTEIESISSLLS